MKTEKDIIELEDALGKIYYKATFRVPDLNSSNTMVCETMDDAKAFLDKFTI